LGGRLACTFGSFDEHGQFFYHRNIGNFLHSDLLALLNARLVNEPGVSNVSIQTTGKRQKYRLRRP
jgi:hypothetical protein